MNILELEKHGSYMFSAFSKLVVGARGLIRFRFDFWGKTMSQMVIVLSSGGMSYLVVIMLAEVDRQCLHLLGLQNGLDK